MGKRKFNKKTGIQLRIATRGPLDPGYGVEGVSQNIILVDDDIVTEE